MNAQVHNLNDNKINIYIQVNDPVLWKEIRKQFYPNFIDKIKGWFL